MSTPEQTKHIRPSSVPHILNNNHVDAIRYKNSLLETSKSDEVHETYWLPNQQNPGNEREHTPIQTRIRNELRELVYLEHLNQENINYRTHFLSIFDWTDFTLELDAQEAVEAPFIGVYEIFALYCFEIGNITSVKVQLRLLDDKPAHSQSFLAPLNLKDGFPWS